MKVKELIAKLQKMSPEDDVIIAGFASYETPTDVKLDVNDAGYEVTVITTD